MDAFFTAIRNEKLPTVRWSLSNIGSLHAASRDPNGLTSFMVASVSNSPRALDMLMNFYARAAALREEGWIDCVDEEGRTALMMAAANGDLKSVAVLLSVDEKHFRGGGEKLLEAQDFDGKTARDYAVRKQKTNVVEYIDDFLAPEEILEEEEEMFAADGLTSTQRSKLKKQELAAQEGVAALSEREQAAVERKAALQKKEVEQQKALLTKPDAIWPEVIKVEESVQKLKPICELTVVRTEVGGDCPVPGASLAVPSPIDPSLWFLSSLNRLELHLPQGILTSLPGPSLEKLDALQILIVSGNSLTSLPEEIGNLKHLRVLEAQANEIAALPESIGKLKKLETLNISSNKLQIFPESMSGNVNLISVFVDLNEIATLQQLPFAALSRLSILSACGNPITELPEEIGELTSLSQLVLNDTLIEEIPATITALKKVKILSMNGCPLSDSKVKKKLEQGDGKALKELWKLLAKKKGKGGGKKGKKKKGKR